MVSKISNIQTRAQIARNTLRIVEHCFGDEAIGSLILNKLPGGNIVRARRINRNFKQMIDCNPLLKEKTELIKVLSEIRSDFGHAFGKAIKTLAVLDFPFALQHARKRASPHSLIQSLLILAEYQARSDFDEAKKIYQEIVGLARDSLRDKPHVLTGDLVDAAWSVMEFDKQFAEEICDALTEDLQKIDHEYKMRIQEARRKAPAGVTVHGRVSLYGSWSDELHSLYEAIDSDTTQSQSSIIAPLKSNKALDMVVEIYDGHSAEFDPEKFQAIAILWNAEIEPFVFSLMLNDEMGLRLFRRIAAEIRINRPVEAKEIFERAIFHCKENTEGKFLSMALSTIASEYSQLEIDRPRELFDEALRLARQQEDPLDLAECLSRAGKSLKKMDQDAARTVLYEAFELVRNKEDCKSQELLAFVCRERATLLRDHALLRV